MTGEALPEGQVRCIAAQADGLLMTPLAASLWPAVRGWLELHALDFLAVVEGGPGGMAQVFTAAPVRARGVRQEHALWMDARTAAAVARVLPAIRRAARVEVSENWAATNRRTEG